MRTNYIFIGLVAFLATFLLASCSELQTDGDMATDGTRTFTFNLTTDEQAQTRAGAPTVDGYKLLYFLQVLDESGTVLADYTTPVTNESGFTVHLPLGSAYTCLFWAHYIANAGDTPNEFFNTDNLQAVTLKKHLTGEDRCQAFCATAAIAADLVAGTTTTVMLHRAVAQVNIKNAESMDGKGYTRLTASYTDVPNTFNVLDNTVGTAAAVGTTSPVYEVTDFSAAVADAGGRYTYQSVYVLASSDGAGSLLGMEIDTYNSVSGATPIQTMPIANIPTKKNFKTNVLVSLDPANKVHTYTCGFEEWGAGDMDVETDVWDGVIPAADAAYAFGGGDGASEATAYVLSKPVHLAYLAANVNAGPDNNGSYYEGKYFKLTKNINLGNKPWNPIGGKDNNKEFSGNFDGNHKQVTNLYIDKSDWKWVGLFGYRNGILKNLHVSGAVNSSMGESENPRTGGIIGYSSYTSNGKTQIRDCSFSGTVTCVNGYVGGIAGFAISSFFHGCKNTGTITGKSAGGIAGAMEQGSLSAENCYNTGTIDATQEAGGISGHGEQGDVKYCYNTGVVTCTVSDKATAITHDSGGTLTITGCYYKTEYATPNSGQSQFGESSWPAEAGAAWKVNASGTNPESNGYWKSVGAWNSTESLRVYPKLWWEE